ncbi:hypothetical protein B0T18DRAFT_414887, partial [Schizothecium vesticola]
MPLTRSQSSLSTHIQDETQRLDSNLKEKKTSNCSPVPWQGWGRALPSPPTPPHNLI